MTKRKPYDAGKRWQLVTPEYRKELVMELKALRRKHADYACEDDRGFLYRSPRNRKEWCAHDWMMEACTAAIRVLNCAARKRGGR